MTVALRMTIEGALLADGRTMVQASKTNDATVTAHTTAVGTLTFTFAPNPYMQEVDTIIPNGFDGTNQTGQAIAAYSCATDPPTVTLKLLNTTGGDLTWTAGDITCSAVLIGAS